MKSSFYKFATVALFVLAATFAAMAQATTFKGAVGDKKVVLQLTRTGGDLSGVYYYVKSGSANKLNLKGTIAADGSFKLQETDAAGKATGNFEGKWRENPNESGVGLEG